MSSLLQEGADGEREREEGRERERGGRDWLKISVGHTHLFFEIVTYTSQRHKLIDKTRDKPQAGAERPAESRGPAHV